MKLQAVMIRFLIRTLGFLLVAAAFAALVVDGTRSIAGGRVLFYGLGDTAVWIGGSRFAALADLLAQAPPPVRACGALLLAAPGWSVTGGLGLLMLLLGRKPTEDIDLSSRR